MDALTTETGLYDETLSKIYESENRSVGKFFDAVFGYFSRNSPEMIFDSSKYYGKQLLLSSYEKWQNKYLKSTNSPVSSTKRAKNDYSKALIDDEKCWQEAPMPGASTYTTYTTTFSKRNGDDNMTSCTESKKEQMAQILNFDTTNGAKLDKYSWTQSIDDIDLRIPIDESISKGSQVKVTIEKTTILVEVSRQKNDVFEPVMQGEFPNTVRPEDCVWLIYPGQHIAILIQKVEEKWWDRCLMVEPPIDLKKIVAERDYHSLPEEDRKQIEKAISDKQREERGEQTSEQTKMESILRKAWDAEDSPFRGQPFDPSLIKVVNSSST